MANFNFNKAIIGGRLTADPELKTLSNGSVVTTFTVAVNRRFTPKEGEAPQADFITVTAWRKTAELVTKYFKKGSCICVTGSIQTRNWTDNEGRKHYATEIVADEVNFVDSRNENPGARAAAQAHADYSDPQPDVDDGEADSALPF